MSSRRFVALLLTMASLSVPAVAPAAPLAPATPPVALDVSAAEWLTDRFSTPLRQAGFHVAGSGPGAGSEPVTGQEVPAPGEDLNGDGHPDLFTFAVSEERAGEMVLRARDGRDGRVLWSRDEVAQVLAAKVLPLGERGEDAVLVVSYDAPVRFGPMAPPALYTISSDVTLRLRALSLDGAPLWAYTASGRIDALAASPAAVMTVVDLPVLAALGDFVAGPSADFAVERIQMAAAVPAGGAASTVALVDGGSGSERCQAAVNSGQAAAVGDLDGDALDDLVVRNDLPLAAGGVALAPVALRAHDCRVLWAADGGQATTGASAVRDAGDVTGDGRADVLLTRTVEGGHDAVLLDGPTGTAVWTKQVRAAYPLGDVDGDGRDDVGAVQWTETGQGLELRFQAYGHDGAARYDETLLVTSWVHPPAVELTGDIDGDGVADVWVSRVGPGESAFVSGRTGRLIRAGRFVAWEVAGTFDGAGDDLLERPRGWTPALEATDGATGSRLWSASFSDAADLRWQAGEMTGDGIDDVLVTYSLRMRDYLALLDGRDGTAVWTMLSGGLDDLPGATATLTAPFRSAPERELCQAWDTGDTAASPCSAQASGDAATGNLSTAVVTDTGAGGRIPQKTRSGTAAAAVRERFLPPADGLYRITARVEILRADASSSATVGAALAASGVAVTASDARDASAVHSPVVEAAADAGVVTVTVPAYPAQAELPVVVDVVLSSQTLLYPTDESGVVAAAASSSAGARVLYIAIEPAGDLGSGD